jgi:hypothetical protein
MLLLLLLLLGHLQVRRMTGTEHGCRKVKGGRERTLECDRDGRIESV